MSRGRKAFVIYFFISTIEVEEEEIVKKKIKSGALNSLLFTLLCEDLDSDHEVLLFHTEVRWLFKGNMLDRFHELKEEVIIFLEFNEKHDYRTMFKNNIFQ
nr:unnamed protein product [Callosobruchus analis]